ncbi:MAG: HDOD domain-containing protein [Pseudomonadota bacterium]|nr:HDOD domain-containing protein [Pseudomonadota bacterium]
MRNDRIIEQLGGIEDIPPLPKLANRIIDTCFNDQINFQEMATLIKQDPILTARILIMINSPAFALPAKVEDLSHAISLLGKKQVRNLALSVTIFDTFNAKGKEREQEMVAFWQHCVACAHACEELAKKLKYPHPEEAFIAGLLHDIGKLIAYHRLEKPLTQLLSELLEPNNSQREWPPLNLEKEILGAGHHLIGKWAAEAWNFPSPIVDAIWLHHQPTPGIRNEIPSLPLLVRFADAICNLYNLGSNYFINHELNYSTSAPYAGTVESLKIFFRLDHESLLNIYHTADNRLNEFGSGLKVVDNKLYFSAIRKANRELGRLNLEREKTLAELELKNRLLEGLAAINRKLELRPNRNTILEEIIEQTLKLCQSRFAFCGLSRHKDAPACWLGQFGNKKFSEKDLASDKALISEERDSLTNHDSERQTKILTTIKRLTLKKSDALLRNSRITPLKEHPSILVVPLCQTNQTIDNNIHGQLIVDCCRLARDGVNKTVLLDTVSHFAAGISDIIKRCHLTEDLAGQSEIITELNRQSENIQYELFRAHRLATVGRLATGAAHEINNPLTVISGQLQILKTKAEKSDDAETNLKRYNKMLGKVDKIASIVKDLLAYGRPQKTRIQSVCVKNIILQSIEAINHRQGFANIKFTINTPDNLPATLVDPQQLGQVLINLLINAQLAMPEDGSIGIRATNKQSRMEISLSDTGCGIAPEDLPSIFDPFFTTREADSGTGLGLSIVHALIEANQGSIEVRSTLNKGTTFTISLPMAKKGSGQ